MTGLVHCSTLLMTPVDLHPIPQYQRHSVNNLNCSLVNGLIDNSIENSLIDVNY